MAKNIRKNSNEPMDYFTHGTQEHTYFLKLVSKISNEYAKKSPLAFEDLAAEARIGAWRSVENFDASKASFPTHLYNFIKGYVQNAVTNYYKKGNDLNSSLDEMRENPNFIESEEMIVGGNFAEVSLTDLLGSLDDRSRKIVQLDSEGYKLAEIAEAIAEKGKKPLSSVRIADLKKKAHAKLKEKYSNDEV